MGDLKDPLLCVCVCVCVCACVRVRVCVWPCPSLLLSHPLENHAYHNIKIVIITRMQNYVKRTPIVTSSHAREGGNLGCSKQVRCRERMRERRKKMSKVSSEVTGSAL